MCCNSKEHSATAPASGWRGLKTKLKSAAKKLGHKIESKMAKHHLLGKQRYDSWQLEELGRKYWTRPAGVDEETFRHSVREPGSTWWHNCNNPKDS
ncbi:hypothetical protein BD289DRAFT_487418, partial [Coniella lustricola]